MCVDSVQRITQLHGHVQRSLQRQRAAAIQPLAQRLAPHVLHDQQQVVGPLLHGEDADDVGVFQRAADLGLPLEATGKLHELVAGQFDAA